jgi:hypothetical protein
MPGLDKATIEQLIVCEKMIVEPPKKDNTLQNRHLRKDMKLVSTDEVHKFSVFLRQSEEFQQDFTIGLLYINVEGKTFPIFRCNGPHGETVLGKASGNPHHFSFHTHTLKADSYAGMEPEHTDKYATFQDAIAYFIKRCNILGADQYFSFLVTSKELQQELGFENE